MKYIYVNNKISPLHLHYQKKNSWKSNKEKNMWTTGYKRVKLSRWQQ